MTTKKKVLIGFLAIAAMLGGAILLTQAPSYASDGCTNLIFKGRNCKDMGMNDVTDLIHIVLNVLTVGMVVAATIGVIYCGYMILTARENTEQLAKGKKRLFEVLIGLALWFCAFGLVNLFIPNAADTGGTDELPQASISAPKNTIG